MSFSRYWKINKRKLDEEFSRDFQKIVESCVEASEECGIKIKGGDGWDEPNIFYSSIELNGDRETYNNFEAFELNLEEDYDYYECRTAKKPYDATVEIILNLAKAFKYVTELDADEFITDSKRIEIAKLLQNELLKQKYENGEIEKTSFDIATKALKKYIKLHQK